MLSLTADEEERRRTEGTKTHMDLLIDADILACQFAYAFEASRGRNTYDDFDTDNAGWAISGFDSAVERMIGQTGTDDALLCFTGRSNFRYSILPTYKSSRRGKPKPVLLDALIEHAWAAWDCREVDCLEADDVMGIMATESPGRYVMATIDKDLKQIPGIHYNWRKERIKDIEPWEADYWFYFQVLTGDSTDGYAGCPGIGVVRARSVLKDGIKDGIRDGVRDGIKGITKGVADHPWARVVRAFKSRGLTEEDALVQARVARILRVDDYDFAERQPILWRPE
jgi:DNA polymerase-1